MEQQLSVNQIQKGKTYKVVLEDCCINGEFTAKVTSILRDGDYIERIAFSNGVILTEAHAVYFEEVETAPEWHH